MISFFFRFSRKNIIIITSLVVFFTYMLVSFRTSQVFADAYVHMNNSRKVAVAPDGTKVVIASWDEHAIISQSITQNGLTRFAMASNNIQALTNLTNSPSDNSSGNSIGTLQVGYYIGCQFPESAATVNATLQINPGNYMLQFFPTPMIIATTAASVEGAVYPANIPIVPGTISTMTVGSMPFTNGSAIIQYTDVEITAQQQGNQQVPCAGYAQARAFQFVDLSSGIFRLSVTKFGQAFGIG